jgi:hypothetical protein
LYFFFQFKKYLQFNKFSSWEYEENIDAPILINEFETDRQAQDKSYKLRSELDIDIPTKHFSLLIESEKFLDAELLKEEISEAKRIKLCSL